MTAAFKGGLSFKLGNTASPIVYSTVEEVKSMSGLGKTNPLVDATSHDSTAREYISGLADGQEITIECLRVHTASSVQDDMITAANAGTNRSFQVVLTDASTSPNLTKTYTFTGTPLSWVITPSFEDANMISFTVKISGDITVS